ncbi:hypothetical protein K2173_022264 [Erythroxylum novogranatense]|uniref:WEB family protein n=1 Tax=Erythroxylum novogranatense TaxID=1862640 RepID=A0AAV8SUY9_9ROSI|nr:hypothetical protein K2173_022264 [Erythroxylum novogranatense]
MEMPTLSPNFPTKTTENLSSTVDTSRPFRSVKEAVAIFGERILVGEIYSPKPYYTPPSHETSWRFSCPPSPGNPKDFEEENNHDFLDSLKKLESELEDTKAELKLLKERESETEVALASLNAELHKNMSKLAEAEATAAKNAVASRTVSLERERIKEDRILIEEEKRRELMMRMENSPTLAQILSLAEEREHLGGKKQRKMTKKKKPIVPLVGDLFWRKKGSSNNNTLSNPLYASREMYFN